MRLWLKRMINRAPKDATYKLFGEPLTVIQPPQYRRGPDLPKIGITTPVKDAEAHLDRYFGLLAQIDYPKHLLHLFFLEGDSRDNTLSKLKDWQRKLSGTYAGFDILKQDHGLKLDVHRHEQDIQAQRRAILSKCRNALMQAAFTTGMDKVLFIDIDLCAIPPDAIKIMLHYKAPIMAANCYKQHLDILFDRNIFRYARRPTDVEIQTHLINGVYLPGRRFPREFPDRFRNLTIAQVHGVGGTFLLIDRMVIEAGVNFPETPYRSHIETEGFSLIALDKGFGSFVLPQLIVRHIDET